MKPKIFVFCNSCAPQWHRFVAIAEDGALLAGHVCSHHGFAAHDMGIDEDGWKRELYAAHYPDGFEVVYVETGTRALYEAATDLKAAVARHGDWAAVIERARGGNGDDFADVDMDAIRAEVRGARAAAEEVAS